MRNLLAATIAILIVTAAGAAAAQPLVEPAWLKERLGSKGIAVVDVRSDEKDSARLFAAGHVPGAVHADYDTAGWRTKVGEVPGMLPSMPALEALIGSLGIDNDTHVVIVPAGITASDMGAATRVYWTFKVVGHEPVSILNGGYAAWAAGGHPVAKGPAQAEPAIFQASFRRELVASREEVQQAIAKGTPLMDNRPSEQFVGKSKSPVAKRLGTIFGARSVPEGAFLGKDGRFIGPDQAVSLWRSAGLPVTGEQIAFCNTGHWASLGWFTAHELLGIPEAKLYDGSLAEWTRAADLPMSQPAQ